MRIIQRTLPYIMATALTAGIAIKSAKAGNDEFYKSEPKIEQEQPTKNKDNEKDIPWMDIISGTCILAFLGILKIADYVEKRENQAEKREIEQTPQTPAKTVENE